MIKGVGRKFSRGGGPTEKRPKISKKYRKIALLSIYLLYLYHVWKSRGSRAPLPPPLPPAVDAYVYDVRFASLVKW